MIEARAQTTTNLGSTENFNGRPADETYGPDVEQNKAILNPWEFQEEPGTVLNIPAGAPLNNETITQAYHAQAIKLGPPTTENTPHWQRLNWANDVVRDEKAMQIRNTTPNRFTATATAKTKFSRATTTASPENRRPRNYSQGPSWADYFAYFSDFYNFTSPEGGTWGWGNTTSSAVLNPELHNSYMTTENSLVVYDSEEIAVIFDKIALLTLMFFAASILAKLNLSVSMLGNSVTFNTTKKKPGQIPSSGTDQRPPPGKRRRLPVFVYPPPLRPRRTSKITPPNPRPK